MHCLLIIVSIFLLSPLIYSTPWVNAENQIDRQLSILTGDQQIPPVNARGYIGLKFQDDLSRLVFTVNAENIGNVTNIYIYRGDKNQNGTVVLDLLKAEKDLKIDDAKIVNVTQGKVTGTLAAGGATKDDLQGKLKGKSFLLDFYNLMVNGSIYVVVHTIDFPKGEIRSNTFVGIDDLFPDDSLIKWD
ncbi:MAG: CHRD domain-containing protein [Nitrososphaerota archaeon]